MCMRVYVYECLCVRVFMYMRVYVYACLYVCVFMCMRVYVYECVCVCVFMCMRVYVYECVCVCVFMCMSVYVYECLCECILELHSMSSLPLSHGSKLHASCSLSGSLQLFVPVLVRKPSPQLTEHSDQSSHVTSEQSSIPRNKNEIN